MYMGTMEAPTPGPSMACSGQAPRVSSSMRPGPRNITATKALTKMRLTHRWAMDEAQLDLVGGQTMWIPSNFPFFPIDRLSLIFVICYF